MKTGRQRGAIAHGAAIQLALCMLSDGRAKSKAHAAQLAGIQEGALKPQSLAKFAARNPIGRQLSQNAPALLEITADVGGKRISARDALSTGVESAIAIIAKSGPRLAKLTKRERERLADAKRWLELSRACGLFSAPPAIALPGELTEHPPDQVPDAEHVPGQLDEFTGGASIPLEPEGVPQECKVEA